MTKRGGSRYWQDWQDWQDWQYYFDQRVNMRLGMYAANLGFGGGLHMDYIRPLAGENSTAQAVEAMLKASYWQMSSISNLLLYMSPLSIFAYWFVLSRNTANTETSESYALLVLSSPGIIFTATELIRLLAACGSYLVSRGNIECLGTMQTIALRAYNT